MLILNIGTWYVCAITSGHKGHPWVNVANVYKLDAYVVGGSIIAGGNRVPCSCGLTVIKKFLTNNLDKISPVLRGIVNKSKVFLEYVQCINLTKILYPILNYELLNVWSSEIEVDQ